MDTQVLLDLGFSSKEVAVYLALLQKSASSVSQIAEKTGIDRTLCYSLLNKLIDRGYVSFVMADGAKEFSAVDPSKLLSDASALQERVQALIPELSDLAQHGSAPLSIQVFKGKEGVRWQLAHVMKTKPKENFLFGDSYLYQQVAAVQLEKYFRFIEEHQLREYLIFPEGRNPGVHPTLGKYRTVPKNLLSLSCFWAYESTAIITIWSEPILTIWIESRAVADNYIRYFKFLWKLGTKKGFLTRKAGKRPKPKLN